ncbi:NAD(P)-dependent dehydrogenase (short-subunit alcohol dehydrogenase family) [Luteibacter sp. 1214]|uniref:oxidoreductase n=1 Tax=Luteibacter sp. 1214 TaxID=2817735 RepID=UPI0028603A73|nr:oxidoreductase [Luteibacter sp. 1214]MDR6642737.1 NAD(P)-dependent dehydrogenase (short-subunit alcohol dehydrogenase family) [Luteibacter sp. 1214]
MSTKTFFITGVSSGFGEALAREALAAGHRVIGTVRNDEARRAFEGLDETRAHGMLLDVTDIDAIPAVVSDAEARFGPVDVLVNNAGYGHEGIFEESPLDEMRRQFEVNVFGAVAVTQAFVPRFRERRRGHIVNITSMGGFITMPGIAYYCGSKFALEGISEVLGKELSPFGVHVTAVAPGSFRTDWAGRSMQRSPRSIPDYDATFDPIRQARQEKSGKQLGDPAKAAKAMLALVELPAPPAHLLLGSDALALVRDKLKAMADDMTRWETLTRSTDG